MGDMTEQYRVRYRLEFLIPARNLIAENVAEGGEFPRAGSVQSLHQGRVQNAWNRGRTGGVPCGGQPDGQGS